MQNQVDLTSYFHVAVLILKKGLLKLQIWALINPGNELVKLINQNTWVALQGDNYEAFDGAKTGIWKYGLTIWVWTGKDDAFSMSVKHTDPFPSRVGKEDVKEWLEDDADWLDEKYVQWLKGLFASFIPAIPEGEIRELWDEMEDAVGKGKRVKFTWPVVQLLATRRE